MRKATRYILLGCATLVTAGIVLFLYSWYTSLIPSKYMGGRMHAEGIPFAMSYDIPASPYTLMLELTPIHPYLAEYHRRAKLMQGNRILADEELFPDTGGYRTVLLYKKAEKEYALCSYGNLISVQLTPPLMKDISPQGKFPDKSQDSEEYCGALIGNGQLLGRFDRISHDSSLLPKDTPTSDWRFIEKPRDMK